MISSLFARLNAIVPIVATASLAGKESFFYKLDGANQAVIVAAATDVPDGLIGAVTANGLEISALKSGGNHGTVRVKLGADVADLTKDLQLRADGTVGPDAGTGARVLVARPVETGVANETIEAILLKPRVFGAAVALTSGQNATAAAVDLATTEALANALKANYNQLQTDVAAIRTALLTSGLLA